MSGEFTALHHCPRDGMSRVRVGECRFVATPANRTRVCMTTGNRTGGTQLTPNSMLWLWANIRRGTRSYGVRTIGCAPKDPKPLRRMRSGPEFLTSATTLKCSAGKVATSALLDCLEGRTLAGCLFVPQAPEC